MDSPSSNRLPTLAVLVAFLIAFGSLPCSAAVVVLSNRTAEPISLDVLVDADAARTAALAPGDSRPIYATSGARVRMMQAGSAREFTLYPNCAYFVGASPNDGSLVLQQIGLGESTTQSWERVSRPSIESADAGVINVKILVDDDEVRTRRVWEPILRERIDKVSAALDAHCGIRMRVVAIDQWDSDDTQNDFMQSMAEFEREVHPGPAAVAIGFSSQYAIAQGRVHLGGTRQPLHTHILLKERSRNVLEPERLELLAHELGHYLGASHSPEPKSVMRPVIGQGVQRIAGARLQYDPPNTLLMALMGQEIRQRRVRDLSDVSPETRRRMREIYTSLDPTLPDDPAANQYVQLVGAAGARPLIDDSKKVLEQTVRVIQLKKKLVDDARKNAAKGSSATPPTGDELLELYVRQAAFAAKLVRPENGPRAFLLALGIVIDDTGALSNLPIARGIIPHIEGEQQRADRIAALSSLGPPTMRGRADLAKHFFVSAHLVALVGSEPARSAGLVKEMLDAQGGSGFSFADMAANRAGIVFANALLIGRLSLDDIAREFTVDAFLPPVDELREQLGAKEFGNDFGGLGDDRLNAELARIEARILALPIYRTARPAKAP